MGTELHDLLARLVTSVSHCYGISNTERKELEQAFHTWVTAARTDEPTTSTKARCTLEEAIAHCESIGLTKQDGSWFHNKMLGQGWKNGGQSVKCWRSTIRAWKDKGGIFPSQCNRYQMQPISPAHKAFMAQKRMEQIEQKLRDIRNQASEEMGQPVYTEQQRNERKKLKDEYQQLQEIVGFKLV